MSSLSPPVELLEPGSRLGRYELLCPVARGGMASVWLARLNGPHGFEKLVAIKTILPQYASDSRFEQMFLDEARIASRIEHANVARVLDLGEDGGTLFLVMEWVDGEALSKIQKSLEQRGIHWPLGVALRLIADACGGLHAAHELATPEAGELGVVHRDVSPQNILVTTHGVAKVIDFGIAKARGRLCEDTRAGSIKGKLQYMPPEQALGRPLDRAADIWAAGATLYFLLSGKAPHDADHPIETVQKLSDGIAPPPLPAHVPECIAAIVSKAMSFEPGDRYATAQHMQQALEEVMRNEQLVTSPMDVERFLRQHLKDRLENRRKAVDLAFGAAVDREHIQRLLFPAGEHSTGVLVGGAYLKVLGPASTSTPPSSRRWALPPPDARRGRQSLTDLDVPAHEARLPTPSYSTISRAAPRDVDDLDADDDLPDVERQCRSCDPREIARLLDVGPMPLDSLMAPSSARRVSLPNIEHRPSDRASHGVAIVSARPPEPSSRTRSPGRLRATAGLLTLLTMLTSSVALEATSHGAFLRHDIGQWFQGSDRGALKARADASTLLGHDTKDAGQAALAVLDAALEHSPHDGGLQAFAAHATFAVELRFGRDPRRHARAVALLTTAPTGPLRDLATGTLAVLEQRPEAQTLLTKALAGPDPHEARYLLAELALHDGRWAEAKAHLQAIEGYSQRLEFLLARTLSTIDPMAARTRGEALAVQAPVHAGVRLLLARLAWEHDQDDARASRWIEQVLALPSAVSSPAERAAAEALSNSMWLTLGCSPHAPTCLTRR